MEQRAVCTTRMCAVTAEKVSGKPVYMVSPPGELVVCIHWLAGASVCCITTNALMLLPRSWAKSMRWQMHTVNSETILVMVLFRTYPRTTPSCANESN